MGRSNRKSLMSKPGNPLIQIDHVFSWHHISLVLRKKGAFSQAHTHTEMDSSIDRLSLVPPM